MSEAGNLKENCDLKKETRTVTIDELCVFASNYEEPRSSAHRQTDWNHRGEPCVDCHGALSIWRGSCQSLSHGLFFHFNALTCILYIYF